jgi:protoporphyrin/coproporphyrin ferrochelatase
MRYSASPLYTDTAPATGVLLVNSGTPDSLTAGGVRSFLRGLLGDPRTIELPRALWLPILYGAILPLRPLRVVHKYRRIWTEQGSPLLTISRDLAAALQARLTADRGHAVPVALGMLYSTPRVAAGLAELRAAGAQRIVVLPLFPQYSGTTSAAAFDQLGDALRKWRFLPEIAFIPDYHAEAPYLDALAESVRVARKPDSEHLLITFHGIPEKYVTDGDPYRRRCESTARAVAARLGLADDAWTLSFQSRVGPQKWLQPYTDDVVRELAGRGIRRLTAICPGFAIDCLETLEEIAVDYAEQFVHAGGERLDYVPALNATAMHVDALTRVLTRHAWPRA